MYLITCKYNTPPWKQMISFILISDFQLIHPPSIDQSADYCVPMTVITVCVVFSSQMSVVVQQETLSVSQISQRHTVPFPRREMLPKPNYIVLPNHQSVIACMDRGKQATLLFCRSKEYFFLSVWFQERKKMHLEILLLFVQHFQNISE